MFVQMHLNITNRIVATHQLISPHAEILLHRPIHCETRGAEFDTRFIARNHLNCITQSPDRKHHRFKIMVTIGTFPNHIQSYINLAAWEENHNGKFEVKITNKNEFVSLQYNLRDQPHICSKWFSAHRSNYLRLPLPLDTIHREWSADPAFLNGLGNGW